MFNATPIPARHGRALRLFFLIFILPAALLALVISAAGQEPAPSTAERPQPNDNVYGTYLPAEMSYQGQLVDANGLPQVGSYSMQFGVYGPPPTYTLRYTEVQTVPTDPEGLFNVMIGAVQPGLDFALAGGDAWLQVQLDGEVLAPLQPIGTVAYAQYAQRLVGGTGTDSAIGGGRNNTAGGDYATVAGGDGNSANARAAVGGGSNNVAGGVESAIGGGRQNSATAGFATIAGGDANSAAGQHASVGGGQDNSASASNATIGGGLANIASGGAATIGGGVRNDASGIWSTIAGGYENTASGSHAVVAGGEENSATGNNAAVGGGYINFASGANAMIPGGVSNFASGNSSLAAGTFAGAAHDNAYVWSDGSTFDFTSTAANQYLIHAAGGVGVNTNAPQSQLHVVDTQNGNATDLSAHVATIENDSTSSSPDVLALVTGATNPGGSVNYVTFFDSSGPIAAIEGNGAGGVAYVTAGADFAEYLPLAGSLRNAPAPGTVLGLVDGGLALKTAGAQRVMVVSSAAGFVGNASADYGNDHMALVAFLGQVPVRVRGPVNAGDLLVASGLNDGTAVAISPNQLTPAAGRADRRPGAGEPPFNRRRPGPGPCRPAHRRRLGRPAGRQRGAAVGNRGPAERG